MSETLSHWVKRFSDCELPVLYKSKRKLYELQKDERDITVTVLAKIARQDPGFSISILRHAGRSTRKEITTLSHAISLISIPLVIKMLNELPVLEQVLDKKAVLKIMSIYSYQYQVALMAKEWSIIRKESENNEIFTAGLNRGFFRFILYSVDPDTAFKLEKIYLTPSDNHKVKEKELLGNTVDTISEAIAKNWKLPELICESFSGKHHNPKITGIRLSIELMHWIHSYLSIHYPDTLIERIAEYIRVPVGLTPGRLNKIIISITRNSYRYLPKQPLLLILMSYPESIRKTAKPINRPGGQQQTLSSCIQLMRSTDTPKTNKQLIDLAVKAMKQGPGFSRILFMSFNAKENHLKTISHSINETKSNIKQLSISLELNKLFTQLLMKEQLLTITQKNQHKYNDLLPEALRSLTQSSTTILSSFFINKKPVGCFFVDHGKTSKPLTTSELSSFKFICKELKAAIESSLVKKKRSRKVA